MIVGILECANGDKYDGDWTEDKKGPNGMEFYTNGDKYDGQWENNLPHGNGSLINKV